MHRVDIIVPVFNEPENFATLHSEVSRLVTSDWQMFVVYDIDSDPTLPVMRDIVSRDSRVSIVKNPVRGVANAFRAGLEATSAEAIMTLMADDPPSVVSGVDEIVNLMYDRNADIVAPSRYMHGGEHWGTWSFKKILSYLAGATLHTFIGLPIHDATYATRCFRRSFLKSINIESDHGFEFALEITVKAYLSGKKILEIPIVWSERIRGVSKFKLFAWLYAYAYWYFLAIFLYYFVRPFRNVSFALKQ